MRIVQAAGVLVVASLVTAGPATAQPEQRVNAYGAAVKAFRDRVDAYLAVHKKAAETVPALKETDDPTKLTSREQALGEAIRQARAGAKAGDIFGADLTPRIRDVIRKDWAQALEGRQGRTGRKHSARARWPTSTRPIPRHCRWRRFRPRCWRRCRRFPRTSSTGSSDAT